MAGTTTGGRVSVLGWPSARLGTGAALTPITARPITAGRTAAGCATGGTIAGAAPGGAGEAGLVPLAHVDEVSGDGRRGRHRRRHQVRTSLVTLPALEVAVRGRGAALARRELVGVHRQTHRAARLAPVEAGGLEYLVEAFGLGLRLHEAGARHDHGVDIGVDRLAADHARDRAQVLDARIGA